VPAEGRRKPPSSAFAGSVVGVPSRDAATPSGSDRPRFAASRTALSVICARPMSRQMTASGPSPGTAKEIGFVPRSASVPPGEGIVAVAFASARPIMPARAARSA